jgi:hypothetical protein
MSGSHSEQQSASTEPCSRSCILCVSGLARRCMLKGGRGHELPRCRMGIGVEYNSPAKPHVRRRATAHLQHPPNLSFEEKDAASALGLFSMTRPLSATNKASGPQRHHRRGSAGTLFSCVLPCLRALDGADGASFEEKETRVKR